MRGWVEGGSKGGVVGLCVWLFFVVFFMVVLVGRVVFGGFGSFIGGIC